MLSDLHSKRVRRTSVPLALALVVGAASQVCAQQPAAQTSTATQPAAAPAPAASDSADPIALTQTTIPLPPPPPRVAPKDDDVTTVSPIEITASNGVPIPKVGVGAPMLSVDEMNQMGQEARTLRSDFEDARAELYDCYQQAYGTPPNPERTIGYEDGADAARRVSTFSRLAMDATTALAKARIDALDGSIPMAQVTAAELERQKEVNLLLKAQIDMTEANAKAIDIQQLVKDGANIADWNGVIYTNAAERAGRKYASVPKEFEDLKLQDIRAVERHDDKGQAFLFVTGSILNTHAKKINIPPLQLTAVDQFGYPLLVQAGEAHGKIDPGKAQAFTYSLKPSPDHTARVIVTFTGVERPGHLDPIAADPVCSDPSDAKILYPQLNPNNSGGNASAMSSARTFQNAH